MWNPFRRKPKPQAAPDPAKPRPRVTVVVGTETAKREYPLPMGWEDVTWYTYRKVADEIKTNRAGLSDARLLSLLTGIPYDDLLGLPASDWNALADAVAFVAVLPEPEPTDEFTFEGVVYRSRYGEWGRFVEAETFLTTRHKGDAHAAAVDVLAATFAPVLPKPEPQNEATHPVPRHCYAFGWRRDHFAQLPCTDVLAVLLFFCQLGSGLSSIRRLALQRTTTAAYASLTTSRILKNGAFSGSIWGWLFACGLTLSRSTLDRRIRSSIVSLTSKPTTKTNASKGKRKPKDANANHPNP